jgi:hypothetical protein
MSKIVVLRMGLGVLVISSCLLFANPFTLKKEKKEEIISESQKQKYAQACGDIIQTFPAVLHALADVHAQATHTVQAFVENDASFCSKTSKNQFDQCLSHAEQIAKQLKQMHKELQEFVMLAQSGNR